MHDSGTGFERAEEIHGWSGELPRNSATEVFLHNRHEETPKPRLR